VVNIFVEQLKMLSSWASSQLASDHCLSALRAYRLEDSTHAPEGILAYPGITCLKHVVVLIKFR